MICLIPVSYTHLEQGAFFEPSTVALHGLNRVNYHGGECVAILGGGTIGMFTMQWAKIFGAKKVVVFDISKERLDLALKLGADAVINTLDKDYVEQAMALTDNKGYGLSLIHILPNNMYDKGTNAPNFFGLRFYDGYYGRIYDGYKADKNNCGSNNQFALPLLTFLSDPTTSAYVGYANKLGSDATFERTYTSYFDDIAYYSTALSSDQIKQLYDEQVKTCLLYTSHKQYDLLYHTYSCLCRLYLL